MNQTSQGRQDTTGVISRETGILLRDMIRRGVTCIGITGLGRDASEDIRARENMIKARVDRDDAAGSLKRITEAYKVHNGRRLWVCTAADCRPRTLGWSQDVPDPTADDVMGTLYMAVKCGSLDARDAARTVLSRVTGLTDVIALPDKVLLTPVCLGPDDLEMAVRVMDALDVIVGGGVQLVPMADYIDISGPEGIRQKDAGIPAAGISALSGLLDIVDPVRMWTDPASEGLMDPDDVRDYCSDYGIEIADDFGGEAYRGFFRYQTKYGLILQEEDSMRISLIPAAGSGVDTWAELYQMCQAQATDDDRARAKELVEKLRAGGREEEPDIITLDWAWDHRDDVPDVTYIPTGIKSYDNVWQGVGVGELTIVTGYSNHGKSTFLVQMMANMIQNGRRIAVYGGENTWKELCTEKIYDVFAGKDNVRKVLGEKQDPNDPDARFRYLPKPEIGKKIRDWCAADRRLWLVNSDKNGHRPDKIMPMLQKIVREHHADVLVVDNLMKLGLTKQGADNNNALTDYINALSCYAKAEQVAVVVVAHPAKDNKDVKKGKRLLTMDDIKGGSEVSQLADRVIMSYLNDPDFEAGYCAKFGSQAYKDLPKVDNAYKRILLRREGAYEKCPAATGFLFVDKIRNMRPDRRLYLPVHYEEGSGRILSHPGERYTYGWEAK